MGRLQATTPVQMRLVERLRRDDDSLCNRNSKSLSLLGQSIGCFGGKMSGRWSTRSIVCSRRVRGGFNWTSDAGQLPGIGIVEDVTARSSWASPKLVYG